MVLKTAKANVAKHYAVVGVLEMWDETLEVMENTLPFFFAGKKGYLIILVSALLSMFIEVISVLFRCPRNVQGTIQPRVGESKLTKR